MSVPRATPPAEPSAARATARATALLRGIDRSSTTVEAVAVLLLYGYCLLMLAEVFSRGFLGTSLAFSWEYSSFAMAGVFFLGLGRALRSGTHVRVTLLADRSGPRVRRALELLVCLAALLLAALVLHALWTLAAGSFAKGLRMASVTATPLVVPQALAVLGAAHLVLELIARAVRVWHGEPAELPRDSLLVDHTGEQVG